MIDFARYPETVDDRGWHMDDRHVHALCRLVQITQPRRILEIGSYRGRSAIAYIEAQRHGWTGEAHLIDLHPTQPLLDLVAQARDPDRFYIVQAESIDAFMPADLCVIDGGHDIEPALFDLAQALSYRIPWIAAHDIAAWPDLADCRGAFALGRILRESPHYCTTTDSADRPGERTHRGLMVAGPTPIPEIFA